MKLNPVFKKSCVKLLLLICLIFFLTTRSEAQFTFTTNLDGSLNIASYTGSGGAVIIPDSTNGFPVTTVGTNAFSDFVSLTGITMGTNVTVIGDYAFYQCFNLTNVVFGTNLTHIGSQAFASCSGLTGLALPDNLAIIGTQAFSDCFALKSINIPESVTNIGAGPFAACYNLPSISVDPTNPAYASVAGVLFDQSQTALIQYPGARSGAFAIPSGINTVGDYAFYQAAGLSGITIPVTVTNIGASAFQGCGGLSAVSIPSSVTTIGPGAFQECGGLSTLSIPGSVTNIGDEAFFLCFNLTSISVATNNQSYLSMGGVLFNPEQTTLIQCPGVTAANYAIPGSVRSIGDGAFGGSSQMTSIVIPGSVTNIGKNVFYHCGQLTNITIPQNVINVGDDAFTFCYDLTGINVDTNNAFYSDLNGVLFNKSQTTLIQYPIANPATSYLVPESVTSIGDEAFSQCHNLTSIALSTNVTNIEALAFQGSSLSKVTIPNGLVSIGGYAFSGTDLSSVTIPDSVTSIGDEAFSFCFDLASVYLGGNAPVVDPSVFYMHENAKVYYLPGTTGWAPTCAGLPTLLWNPQVQSVGLGFGVSNNQFGFNVTGANNLVVVVEACTNLTKPIWTPVSTNTFAGGTSYFTDPQWTNYPSRYYRFSPP